MDGELGWITTADELRRELSTEEAVQLATQKPASDFKRAKVAADAQRNWDRFYRRNADNFFKDRHWTQRDLELILDDVDLTRPLVFLEAGCGVGNTLFPLATSFPHWRLCACDFSANALDLVRQRADQAGVDVETCLIDLTAADPDSAESVTDLSAGSEDFEDPQAPSLSSTLFSQPADILSLIFVLSALDTDRQRRAVAGLRRHLRPGASVVVRDYGALDHAMLRFGRGSKLSDRFYARQDGTCAYFFVKDELTALFEAAGFETRRCEYLYKKTVNQKEQLSVDRVFVQGRFVAR